MVSRSSTVRPRGGALWVKLGLPVLLVVCIFANYRLNLSRFVTAFYTGPGSYSRICAVALLALNWKSLPFAWNVRMWYCMVQHLFIREFHTHTPDKLFHPVISESYTSIGEIDYRLHKSNSTYLADLDISRSHLVSHLVARAGHLLARNAKTRIVMDPSDPSKPARGSFNIGIGAVHCSFKREIKPYQKYEMWSRILTWDRKWLYIVTHFVKKGAVLPRSWDAKDYGPARKTSGSSRDWEKEVFATAITTYVFKLGRLTIHPAIMLGASGLLPDRPGGWTSDNINVSRPSGSTSSEGTTNDQLSEWSWERTEKERQRGLVYADHLLAMDGLHNSFDGGENGALGRFSLG